MILRVDFKTDIFREFDIDKDVSLNEFIDIFNEHTTLKETKNSYIIKSPFINMYLINGRYYLKITHFAKDAFVITLNIDGEKFGYTGKYYKDSILKIVAAFSENRIQDLKSYLKEKISARKWSLKDFEPTDYSYFQKHFFSPSIIFDILFFIFCNYLFLFYPFSIYSIELTSFTNFVAFASILAIFSFYNLLVFASFILKINHYKCSRNIKVKILRNNFIIQIDGIEKVINNSDIEFVIYKHPSFRGYPFVTSTNIKLRNGTIFEFSEGIFHIYNIVNQENKIKTIWLSVIYPYIKRPKFSDKMLN